MPFYCRSLEQQTDRRWRRDWRIVTYRLEQDDDGKLKWRRYSQGTWFQFRESAQRRMSAHQRADKIPQFVVHHGRKLTPTQAKRLSPNVTGAPAWDWIHEQDHPRYDAMPIPEPEPEVTATE